MSTLTVSAVIAAVGVLVAIAGVALGRIFTKSIHEMDSAGKFRRIAGIVLLSVGIFVAIIAFTDVKPEAPPWQKDEAKVLAQAKSEGRPVLIDFWASWCGACKDLDRDFFTRDDVRETLSSASYLPAKMDLTDDEDPKTETTYKKYGIVGLPTFALVDPSTDPPTQLVLSAKALVDHDATLCAIKAFPAVGAKAAEQCAAGTGTELEDALQGNLLLALFLVFLGGVASSFTPCVYPMIPITVALFGAKDSGSRLKSFLLSLTYVGGIAITFTSLGLVAAYTGGLFGQVLQSGWVVGGIALVLLALGLSMVGLYAIRMPDFIQVRVSKVGGKGWGGALALGLVAGVLFAPCVGPVLVTLLTYIAQERDLVMGAVLMIDYAFGMGLLFIGLGTFSGVLQKIPRGGNWLEGIEVALGCLLIAMALFYLKDLVGPLKAMVPWAQALLQA
jgi:thiol:disulfide interchange protein